MKSTIMGAAIAAALTLTALSARAGCSDPRLTTQQGAPVVFPAEVLRNLSGPSESTAGTDPIVGTWRVSYTVEGGHFADAFIQWHSDGTEWENINLPVMGGNICLGSWKRIDAEHVFRNHVGWLYTNGVLTGYFTEQETDVIAPGGTTYGGVNQQNIYDLAGTLQVSVTGTSAAVRISP
jgi:hypothetical protein